MKIPAIILLDPQTSLLSCELCAILVYDDNMNGFISENTISHISYAGILTLTSDNNRIQENDISDCGFYGINVGWGASNNLIKENTIEGSGQSDWDGIGEGNIWKENVFTQKHQT